MSAAHTPGPWMACGYGDYGDYGGRCCIVIGDDGTTRIAAVMGHQEEAEADARLIAAAPQQHDALLAVLHAPGFDALDDATKNAVRAAIATATGCAA